MGSPENHLFQAVLARAFEDATAAQPADQIRLPPYVLYGLVRETPVLSGSNYADRQSHVA
jgi:hypothetical protein